MHDVSLVVEKVQVHAADYPAVLRFAHNVGQNETTVLDLKEEEVRLVVVERVYRRRLSDEGGYVSLAANEGEYVSLPALSN